VKVFLSCTSLKPHYGGLAFSVAQMAAALSRAGVKVGLWSADGSVMDTPLLGTEVPFLRFGGNLRDALDRFQPDIVHDNGLWLAHHHRVAQICRARGLPRLVSPHGMLEPWARRHKKWKKDIAWHLYQRNDIASADGLHATAVREAENLAKLGLGVPIHLIPHSISIPTERVLFASQRVRTALFMGRLHPVKGLPMLIEAWSRVRPESWRLILAGPDEAGHRAELETLIAARGLGEVVTFVGPLGGEKKEEALSGADLFVLPSHSESFGMVIAEALAHGLPVLTTTGAPWPALTQEAMGWRTPTTVEGIATGLVTATTRDAQALREMGARGRAFVAAEFGWEKVSQKFLSMYDGILATGIGSAAMRERPRHSSTGNLKVLLCATSLSPRYGGPAYSVSRLALALVGAGADVALWSADGSVMDTPLLSDDCPVTRLSGKAGDAIAQFRPDIVHDNGLWLAHNHRLAQICRSLLLPRLVSTRGMLEPWARRHKRWKKDVAWIAYQRRDIVSADGLHATAMQEADSLARLKTGLPVYVIPNCVDVPPAPPAPPVPAPPGGVRTALFLGRLYPVKGLPLLIEAWSRVRPKDWRLVLAGPDEAGHRQELQDIVRKHGLQSVITFVGPLVGQEKEDALFAADLFVLPSHSESFGMAIAEALAHSLPVLTTTGAPWPALTEKIMGWRTPISVEGLALGLAEATSRDTATLREMGARGRTFMAAELGWDRIARQFLATYLAIVAKSTAPSAQKEKFH
jgi:glycosyltransferase involved in cell wall biosynthesis